MRIHLPLHPHHFAPPSAAAGPSSSPLVQIGGDLVLIELQGELRWEGDKAGGVVGVLGLERPDKPTLHLGEHHLLHGKIASLQKPYAVIRKVVGAVGGRSGAAMDGDLDEEEEEAGGGGTEVGALSGPAGAMADRKPARTPSRAGRAPGRTDENRALGKRRRLEKGNSEHSGDEDEDGPLFPPEPLHPTTPPARHPPSSSSPFLPPSSIRDYSSELDFSSPLRPPVLHRDLKERSRKHVDSDVGDQDDEEEEEERETEDARRIRLKFETKRAERRATRPPRIRSYEVVGVVRKKVVFALRPEPIVTATVLPD